MPCDSRLQLYPGLIGYIVNALSVLAGNEDKHLQHSAASQANTPVRTSRDLSRRYRGELGRTAQKQVGPGNLFMASVASHSSLSLLHAAAAIALQSDTPAY